mgnify:FL=1
MIVRGKNARLRQTLAAGLMLAPALAVFLTFSGWPALRAFWIAGQDSSGFSPRSQWVGWRNFQNLFGQRFCESIPILVILLAAAVGLGLFCNNYLANTPRLKLAQSTVGRLKTDRKSVV